VVAPLSSWIGAAASLIIGAAIGILFTFAHHATWDVAGVPLPIGLTLGLAGVGMYLFGLRLLTETRVAAIASGIGIVGAATFLAAESATGSIIVDDSVYGWVWMVGVGIVTAAGIVWPTRRAEPERRDTMGRLRNQSIEEPE